MKPRRVWLSAACFLLACSGEPSPSPAPPDRPDAGTGDVSFDGGATDLPAPDDVPVPSDVPGDLAEEDRSSPDASVGARWESLGCGRRIRAIWGAGPSDVYFTAEGMGVLHLRPDGRVVTEAAGRSIESVWGRSATEVYATSGAEILRSDGSGSWTSYTRLPERYIGAGPIWGDATTLYAAMVDRGGFPGMGRYLPGMGWAIPRTSDVLSVWNFANEHIFLGISAANTAVLHHSVASGEFTYGTGFPRALEIQHRGQSIWGSALDDIYAIASNNLSTNSLAIYHSTGGDRWTALVVPGMNNPTAVWGSSRGDVYVTQYGGTILHLHGGTWTTESTPSSELTSIWGSDANHVFAGGNCILRRVAQ